MLFVGVPRIKPYPNFDISTYSEHAAGTNSEVDVECITVTDTEVTNKSFPVQVK